jgi:hypothetical protein
MGRGVLKLQADVESNILNICRDKNYTFLGFLDGQYIKTAHKISIQCNKDNHIWLPTYNNFMRGKSNCPKCQGNPRQTHQERLTQIINKCDANNYNFLGFTNNNNNRTVRFNVKCNKDNFERNVSYYGFIVQNSKCPKCGKTYYKTQEEALLIIQQKCKEKNYTFIDFVGNTYKNNRCKLIISCDKHQTNWNVSYASFINNNSGCPICRQSKGEFIINKYLKAKNIEFITQHTFINCKNERALPFDFYLPAYNTCIEFDGEQHFRQIKRWQNKDTFKHLQQNDKIKTDYCLNNKINLLRISYKENILNKLSLIK